MPSSGNSTRSTAMPAGRRPDAAPRPRRYLQAVQRTPVITTLLIAAALAALAALTGCTTPEGRTVTFSADRYSEAFDATRETLRAAGFPIERVDARAGVIATGRKDTAGLATPWDGEQQTLGQEWQDLLNAQSRRVRVTFRPADADPSAEISELGQPTGELTATVEATIDRRRQAGWRPETESIRMSSRWQDPTLAPLNKGGVQYVPMRQDDPFAAVIAERLRQALAEADRSAQTSP